MTSPDWYTDTGFVASTITDTRDTDTLGRRLAALKPLDFPPVTADDLDDEDDDR